LICIFLASIYPGLWPDYRLPWCWWHVFGYDASSTDYGIFSNGDSAEQSGTGANGRPSLNQGGLAIPIHFRLELACGISRPRIAVVDESNTVTDEDAWLDRDTFTDKSVTADLAAVADSDTLLNFNERPNLCFIANFTAVQVHEPVNSHVATELHIWSNALVLGDLITHAIALIQRL
jgi:hypothetical protein